jgi:hypothetical protein
MPNIYAAKRDSVVLQGIVRECNFENEKIINAIIYIVIYEDKRPLAYTLLKKDGTFTLKIPRIFLFDSLTIRASQLLETHDSVQRPSIYDYSDSEDDSLFPTSNDTINTFKFCTRKMLRCGPGPRFFFELNSVELLDIYGFEVDSAISQIKGMYQKYPSIKLNLELLNCNLDLSNKSLQKNRLQKIKSLLVNAGIPKSSINISKVNSNAINCDSSGLNKIECHSQVIYTVSNL